MCKLESNKEKGGIIMTEEGQKRAKIMEMIKEKRITQREAATRLDLSELLSEVYFHIPLSKDKDLKNIICYNYVRKISSDYVVRVEKKNFQLLKNQNIDIRPGDNVIVKI